MRLKKLKRFIACRIYHYWCETCGKTLYLPFVKDCRGCRKFWKDAGPHLAECNRKWEEKYGDMKNER